MVHKKLRSLLSIAQQSLILKQKLNYYLEEYPENNRISGFKALINITIRLFNVQ